jgi:hypothetical protein
MADVQKEPIIFLTSRLNGGSSGSRPFEPSSQSRVCHSSHVLDFDSISTPIDEDIWHIEKEGDKTSQK